MLLAWGKMASWDTTAPITDGRAKSTMSNPTKIRAKLAAAADKKLATCELTKAEVAIPIEINAPPTNKAPKY